MENKDNKELLLDIMEKTIASLELNKDSVISLIENMESEHEKKKRELMDIKRRIPTFLDEVKRLAHRDSLLRQKLALASDDFSETGHEHLKTIYDEANKAHYELLKAEEEEENLIRRRNNLELELKNSEFYINQAEQMAQQLIVSLSYLQTGVKHLNVSDAEDETSPVTAVSDQYVSFLKSIENEKLHIARDLHDGPAQQIASAQMRVDFCKTIIRHDLEKGLTILDQLKSDLSSTLTEVRNILFNLTPAPLEKMGLRGSIDNLLNTILDSSTTNFSFEYDISQNLESTLETTIYRIVQELINNIKKHSQASNVTLKISSSDTRIYMYVYDDGVGFEVPDDLNSFINKQKSFGLSNILNRINDLDGKILVDSNKINGTTFKIQLPV
ncbi:MAG: histidine kinase [Proteocatella sp.]